MTIQLTIIGLGQIGASIGLALKDKGDMLKRVGNDREPSIAKYALKLGAVDRTEYNLPKSVRGANLVLLSLPSDEIRETMEFIAKDLNDDCVVMDTGPVKEAVASWASEILPPNRHYIGLTPVINPAYLHTADSGVEAARADLFHAGLMAIVAPPNVDSGAIKLASDLARLLGATPFFVDPVEIDGLMAATHLLPQLLAAGLLNATVDQPGWREGSKVAGRAYAEGTGPVVHLDDAKTLQESVMLNRENTLRVLDSTIAALGAIRRDIADEDSESLTERLQRARTGRENWWAARVSGEPVEPGVVVDIPSDPGLLKRMFGVGRKTMK